jgi:hypothetical protein
MGIFKPIAVVLALAAISGCAPSSIYDWGSYESSVSHLYSPEPTAHAVKDRQQMIEEVRKTIDGKKQVPPGKYAQIGYLCYLSGDTAAARQYFQHEKDAYPESAKFMDSLMGRLK